MATNPFLINLPIPKKDGSNTFNFQQPNVPPANQVKIGDFSFPGICEVSVHRDRKTTILKKKKGKGDRGVDSGINLARISIKCNIYWKVVATSDVNVGPGFSYDENAEFQAMQEIADYFETRLGVKSNGKTQDSFPIVNPITRARNVFNVYVESISGPVNYMPPGRQEWTFECLEVVIPKDQSAQTMTPKTAPVKLTSAVDPSFTDIIPSQDKQQTQPRTPKI